MCANARLCLCVYGPQIIATLPFEGVVVHNLKKDRHVKKSKKKMRQQKKHSVPFYLNDVYCGLNGDENSFSPRQREREFSAVPLMCSVCV